jgi:hypothetical protein
MRRSLAKGSARNEGQIAESTAKRRTVERLYPSHIRARPGCNPTSSAAASAAVRTRRQGGQFWTPIWSAPLTVDRLGDLD